MATKPTTHPVPTPDTLTLITALLFRKDDGRKPERITKAKREAVAAVLRSARVHRPELVTLVLSGAFHELAAVLPSVIDSPDRRDNAQAWVIPATCLGRTPKSGERNWKSTAESIRLWLKAVFVETGVLRETEFSVVIVTETLTA